MGSGRKQGEAGGSGGEEGGDRGREGGDRGKRGGPREGRGRNAVALREDKNSKNCGKERLCSATGDLHEKVFSDLNGRHLVHRAGILTHANRDKEQRLVDEGNYC